MRPAIVLVFATLLVSCTSSNPPPAQGSPAVEGAAPFFRDCDSAVFGDVNTRNAATIGPLMLVGIPQAAHLPLRAFKPHEGRYGAIKLLAVVNGSSDVTVTVPESKRDSVRLLYDPEARANKHGFLLSAGDARVTFQACRGAAPQYNGGFIATAPSCLNLEVQSAGSPSSGWVSLGVGDACPT
jgi:hypothetical protein